MTPTPDDIRDIHGPIAQAIAHAWWPYAISFAALVAMAAVIVLAIRKLRRRAVPADVAALRALEAARPLIEGGDPRGFSSQVSTAVRDYVEHAFGVHAPKLTTEELLADLMADPTSKVAPHRGELGTFLEFCDLAKYARWSLSRADMTGMLDSAEVFVRATAGGHAS
ncbi:MAG TPA: DUF4381 family protein [Kofleriaceae bacterium]|jgi:hypothetical protein|nr:DUF4381 family protein [Kofleriaceae bacterium]